MPEKKRVRTEGQKKYQKQYNNEHVVWRKVSFNDKNPDDEVLKAWVDSQKPTSAYIKRLIREDMEKQMKDPV